MRTFNINLKVTTVCIILHQTGTNIFINSLSRQSSSPFIMNIQFTFINDSNSPYVNRSPKFVSEQHRSKISLPSVLPLNKLLRESHYYLRGATRRASNFPKYRENKCDEDRAISKELRHVIEEPASRLTQPAAAPTRNTRRSEMVLGVI